MARRQWVGLEDAPGTESVILHAQLANGKIGLGGKLLHDQIGPTEKPPTHWTMPTGCIWGQVPWL